MAEFITGESVLCLEFKDFTQQTRRVLESIKSIFGERQFEMIGSDLLADLTHAYFVIHHD